MKKLFIIIIALFAAPVFAGNNWKLVIDKNNVKVYSRSLEGSDIHEFKAVTVVNARMEEVGEVLRDIQAFSEWMENCKEARIIKKFDDNNYIVYTAMESPWPVSDRDVIVRSTTSVDPDTGSLIVNSRALKEDLVPVTEGSVRMKELIQKFILEYISGDRTRVIYMLKFDPEVNLPAFLINRNNKNYPYKSLLGLKRMVRKTKYAEAAKKSLLKNQGIAKKILKARIKKYIKDKKLIIQIVNDNSLVKQILLGKGSEEEIAKLILKARLKKYIRDKNLINQIVNDNSLVKQILMGKKSEEEIAQIILKLQLKKSIKDIQSVELIAKDNKLLKTILNNSGQQEEIIDAYLKRFYYEREGRWIQKK